MSEEYHRKLSSFETADTIAKSLGWTITDTKRGDQCVYVTLVPPEITAFATLEDEADYQSKAEERRRKNTLALQQAIERYSEDHGKKG